MKLKKIIYQISRTVVCVFAVCAFHLCVLGYDMPVKTLKGQEYFCYSVEPDETIYSISNKIGISPADIVKYNPSLFDGLKAGMILYFPVSEFGEGYGGSTTMTEHVVKKGDTLFSLAGKYGVPTDAIIALNPGVDKGIKEGQKILIPGGTVVQQPQGAPANQSAQNSPVEQQPQHLRSNPTPAQRPAEKEVESVEAITNNTAETFPNDGAPTNTSASDVPDSSDTSVVADDSFTVEMDGQDQGADGTQMPVLKVGICLPFMLNEEEPGKPAQYATDFYRGFLLAIDSLHQFYSDVPVQVTAVDCGNDISNPDVRHAIARLSDADIIVAPDNQDGLAYLARFGRDKDVFVFNVFQARDSLFIDNPYMLQGNIPASDMYDKVVEYFISHLNGATPVFLDNVKGKRDKSQFVDMLSSRLVSTGIDYRTLAFDGVLTSSAILEKLPVSDNDYVFVPNGGSPTEFNKFATALSNYKAALAENSSSGSVRLFGYPEYTRLTGDAYDKLKSIGTTFYSRFFNDATSRDTEAIARLFSSVYGEELPDGIPNQVLYGFDVARWMLELGSRGEVTRDTILETKSDTGAQMYYRFKPVYGGGLYNDTLIMVTFNEEGTQKIEVL